MRVKVTLLSVAAGLVLLGFGLYTWVQRYHTKHGGVPTATSIATKTLTTPSEEPVPDSYSVPADQPLSITMPRIGVKGFIQKVSVDKSNVMVAPTNTNMAGWYVGGAKPGDDGLAIIDGHVSGKYGRGIFHDLAKAHKDDTFTVTYGDKSVRNFKIDSVQMVSITAAGNILFDHNPTFKQQLNLITCGGTYIADQKTFNGRVIVTAHRI